MTRLLVSVRSAQEAEDALAGGAGLVDVKEPARGSLGRADDSVVRAVLQRVAGRRSVSAALGEVVQGPPPPCPGVRYAKWGLAGAASIDWRKRLKELGDAVPRLTPGCHPVAVAYADGRAAGAPDPEQVCAFACAHRWKAFLVDTWAKPALLTDHVSVADLRRWISRCRAAGVEVALAGSLGIREIERLCRLRPHWFAVRGAACRDGRRGAAIDADRVRALAAAVRAPKARARSAS